MRNTILVLLTLSLISLILALTWCQSSSYYAAQNTNHKRFDGWNRQDADFLVKTHDLVKLIEALSQEAEKQATMRSTYVLSKDIQDELESIYLKFKVEAAVKRVKLASSLSEKSDGYVQKLSGIPQENFDKIYHQYLRSTLNEVLKMASEYIREGHTDRLKSFSRELKVNLEPILERTQSVDLS